jgi:hypothetical protein
MGANAQTTVPTFTAGQVLTAAQMNDSARTGVPVFADTSARDAGFGGTGEKTLAEGQLCYLEDSDVVQYYDGSSWATVGPSSGGLALIETLSPSAVTTAQFTTGNLSATYSTYLVTVNVTGASNSTFICQMRSAGSTITSANYQHYFLGSDNAGGSAALSQINQTSWNMGNVDSIAANVGTHYFFSPSVSRNVQALAYYNTATATAAFFRIGGLRYGANQAFDSLLFTAGANMTGTIKLYGVL